MVKHVVFFKFKDSSMKELEKAKELCLSMKGNVELVRDVNVGIDFLRSERSYDLLIEVTLDSRESLEPYQNDPYHVNVVKSFLSERVTASVSVDYEF